MGIYFPYKLFGNLFWKSKKLRIFIKNYKNLLQFLEDIFNKKIDLIAEDMIKPNLKSYIKDEVIYLETA